MIDLKAATAPERKMATRANGIKTKMSTADPESKGEPTEIAATAEEYIFWRPPSHVSALGSYGLREFLNQHGVKSLLLAGFSTSGCVINTAKQAADSGFITTIISDACGDKSEEAHRVIMERLLVGQCHVVDEETFVNTWDGDLTSCTEKMAITGS
jgi:nicotinamidase-related amidase